MKTFLDFAKLAKKYNFQYVNSDNGAYSANTPNLGRKGLWVSVEPSVHGWVLKASDKLVNNHNSWMDELAHDVANDRVSIAELV